MKALLLSVLFVLNSQVASAEIIKGELADKVHFAVYQALNNSKLNCVSDDGKKVPVLSIGEAIGQGDLLVVELLPNRVVRLENRYWADSNISVINELNVTLSEDERSIIAVDLNIGTGKSEEINTGTIINPVIEKRHEVLSEQNVTCK